MLMNKSWDAFESLNSIPVDIIIASKPEWIHGDSLPFKKIASPLSAHPLQPVDATYGLFDMF